MYLGIAGQSLGAFIFGIIWPAFKFRDYVPLHLKKKTIFLGLLLISLWMIFPFFDMLNSFMRIPVRIQNYIDLSSMNKIIIHKSQLPSSILMTGCALVGIGMSRKSKVFKREEFRPWESFVRGAILSTSIFGLYFLIQHVTGFDYRRASLFLNSANQMESGLYRIYGLYGHTLSVSGASLALFSFWGALAVFKNNSHLHVRGSLLFLTILNLAFVLMGGGRTSAVIAFAAVIFLVLCANAKRVRAKVLAMYLFGITCVCATIFWKIGIFERVEEMFSNIRNNQYEANLTRVIFWEVYAKMLADSPWLGHGAGRIGEFIRTAYYSAEGYGHLEKQYNAHNIYLEILANVGVMGFLATVVGVVYFWKIWKKYFLSHIDDAFAMAFLLSLFANAVHGLTQNVFFDANVVAIYVVLFWMLFWESVVSLNLKSTQSVHQKLSS